MKDSDWEILYELYRNPNMTKVANLLYMTQPSLTKRLQHMESEFQVTIVNRTPKGLEFTEEGKFLGKQAETVRGRIRCGTGKDETPRRMHRAAKRGRIQSEKGS